MNNYTENDSFEFGNKEENRDFLGNVNETNYENPYLFNTEVQSDELNINNAEELTNAENSNNDVLKNNNYNEMYSNSEENQFNFNVFDAGFEVENKDVQENANEITDNSPFVTLDSENIVEEAKQEILSTAVQTEENPVLNQTNFKSQEQIDDLEENKEIGEELPIEVEELEENDNSFDKKTEELSSEINSPVQKIQMADEDLTSLTTFEEDKVESTDIKSLFDRVGINVKEASDVFKRNTEMKEKLDSRFEELKKLQLEVARKKDEQYAEINTYKEEVLNKLTEKKEEIERRLNKLKEFQSSLEKEKEEFEQYRKKEKEEIERVQKEVQEAYDSRREELNHIEDVLRRQKDLLDEERSQLSLDKIQYEADKNELANNLLKFNEIVGAFTNGIDKLDKE